MDDRTPYPMPAEPTKDYTAPPPDLTPPSEPVSPAQSIAPEPPARPKSRVWIGIVVVAAVLLVCCCGGGAAIFYLASTDSEQSVTDTSPAQSGETNNSEPLSTEESRRQEWRSFDPDLPEMMPLTNPAQTTIAKTVVDEITPEATYVEARFTAGYYDELEDTYFGDQYIALVVTPGGHDLALQFYVQTDEMKAADIGFDDLSNAVDWLTFELADGTGVAAMRLFETDALPYGSPEHEALLEQIIDDWPDAVATWIHPTGAKSGSIEVFVTTWRAFAIDVVSPGYWVVYKPDGAAWEIVDWHLDEASREAAPIV